MKAIGIKKILVPLDFSDASLNALDYAESLSKLTGAEIILLHIIENLNVTTDPFYASIPPDPAYEEELKKISSEALEKAAQKISSANGNVVKTFSAVGRTHKEILSHAEKLKADIIIMGTHGVSGFREFVMGSNTFRVVSDSKFPVLSVQKKSKKTVFKNILVPFSDHPHSREKIMYAIMIAGIYRASLNIVGIDDVGTAAHAKKITLEAKQIKAITEKHDITCSTSVVTAPRNAKTILNHAKKVKADLIVTTGDTARQNLKEYFSGSVSQQIVNHSPVPVLSVHSKFNPKTIELWQGI